MEYSYPIEYDWSTDEMVTVISFYEAIEKAYDKGIKKHELMERYREFKTIVPGKATERNLCSEFEEVSGFSAYKTMQAAKERADEETIRMKA